MKNFELCEIFGKASSHKIRPHYSWSVAFCYRTRRTVVILQDMKSNCRYNTPQDVASSRGGERGLTSSPTEEARVLNIKCYTWGVNYDKRQTRPLVREGAPNWQDWNFHYIINIWSWAPDGARHQDRPTDWPSVVTWPDLPDLTWWGVKSVTWIQLAEDKIQRWTLVNTEVNFVFHKAPCVHKQRHDTSIQT
jgi:hypothetical protein